MRRLHVLLLLLATIAVTIGGVQLVNDDGDGRTDRVIVPVPRKAPAGDLAAPAGPVAESAPESELRDDTPPEVPAAELDKGHERTDQLAKPLTPQPVGGAQNYSCRRDFSGGVYSSRNGAKPTEWVLHYTVSPNVAGWGDVLGIQSYFKRTRVASATFIADFEGRCLQMAPEASKPWTQGAANPYAISVEIIATGRETRAQWLASPLIAKGILSSLVRDSARRNGIPLRRVDPSGCVFIPGVTDHNALECGNSHTDVAPSFPWDVFMRQLQDGPKPVTVHARGLCQELNRLRKVDHRTQAQGRRAQSIKKALAKKYVCTFGPPGRITRR